jgi:hypothetical protein
VNILHQTRVYTASVHTDLDFLTEILISSLTFSQALFMSSLSFKFFSAADLSEILGVFMNILVWEHCALKNYIFNVCFV